MSLDSRATDYLGKPAAPLSWTFDVDISGPSVISSVPAHRANDVPLTQTITLNFDEALDITTVNSQNIRFTDARSTPVPATVTALDARTVQIQPRAALALGTSYFVSIESGLRDARGNAASSAIPLSFNTVQGLLSYPQTLPGTSMRPAATADVDGDGRVGILGWVSQSPATLGVHLQAADGTFVEPLVYTLPDRSSCYGGPYDLTVADINGDARPDLLFVSSCGLEIILQGADRQFSTRVVLPAEQVSQISVVDLDGDGLRDIVGSGSLYTVTVWRQGPGFSFGAGQTVELFSNGFGGFAIGDLNGDGRADLVATSGQGDLDRALGITYQQADGSFAVPLYQRLSGAVGDTAVTIADLDGDGRQDLLVDDPALETVSWFRQAPDGSLEARREIGSTWASTQLLVTDMDGNGRADLVAWVPSYPPFIVVHLQAADGSFGPRLQFTGPEGEGARRAMQAADLNADGLPDLVFPGSRIAYNQGVQAMASQVFVRRGVLGRALPPSVIAPSVSRMTPP